MARACCGHRVNQVPVLDGPASVGGCIQARRRSSALARPTGVGSALTAYGMPIEDRGEWLAAVARLFA